MAMVTKTKANSRISLMMHKGLIHVEEEIREARGVKEVAKISSKTIQKMVAENA